MFTPNKKGRAFLRPPFLIYWWCARLIARLPAATAADHLYVSHRQVAMLVRMVLGVFLGFFLGIVHFFVVHRARDADGVPHIVRQTAMVTLEFPSRAVISHELEVIAFPLQATRHFPDFAPIIVAILLRVVRKARARQQR